jgi:hypothetical protein
MLAPSQSILETPAPSVDIAAHAKNAWKNHKSQLHSPICIFPGLFTENSRPATWSSEARCNRAESKLILET